MLDEHSTAPYFPADVVYAKTARGRAEVAQRGGGVGARERTVLIMLDGQKTCAALTALMPAATLAPILAQLESLGLIRAATMPPAASPTPAPAPAPPLADVDLAPAKATMIRIAEAYLGLLGADVIRQVAAADNEEQLLRALGHWHMAMQASKRGRDVAHEHLDLIKSSLRAPQRLAAPAP